MSFFIMFILMLFLLPIVLFGDSLGCLFAIAIFAGIIIFIGFHFVWILSIVGVIYGIKQMLYIINYIKLPNYDDYLTLNNGVYTNGTIKCANCGSGRLSTQYLFFKNSPWIIVKCLDSKEYLFKSRSVK